ncbi:MAG: hydroxysqualene dehydroxylase [Acetobacteraceae bacterium]|jgi:squalene-associated FAD-dependent desaturase|nr:hydroxysqualene dehydroxylase [Acetobacteraceae bacterium]
MSQVHVIGAGLAGLAAALSLTAGGRSVTVHEAGPAAGGRCRSYLDKELGLRIDNGNHLLLSGNRAARAYIAEIGAQASFQIPNRAVFPFMDLKTGERWVVRLNRGRIPWWVFNPRLRVPETRLSDYLGMARIARIRNDTPVADSMRRGRLYWRLLEPIAVAALNTSSREGLARLLGAVMRETLLRGGKACLPMLPRQGLSEALIDPAVATLRARGAEVRFNSRIGDMTVEGGKVAVLRGPEGPIPLGPNDAVVLAVPPWVATDLLPGLVAPEAFEAILNIHFLQEADPSGPIGQAGFIGLTSGTAEWVFRKPGHVSVTISAANNMVDDSARALASLVWPNVVDALGLHARAKNTMPAYRVVKEKRATFAATAEQEARRPRARTDLAANLALAGDWTNTGLPATIEGAIRSGRSAADVVLSL